MLTKPKRRNKPRPVSIMKYAKDYCQYCNVHGRPNHSDTSIIDPPHHIGNKGMGGSSRPEIHSPENLITLCRYHHNCAEHKVKEEFISREQLRETKRIEEEGSV